MATINDFGIPNVQRGAILQPKAQNKFRVTFAGIGGLPSSRELSMQVVQAKRPSLHHEEIELRRYNSRAWVASQHNWDEMTMSVEDDVGSLASKIIQSQMQLQQHLIGVEGPWLATATEGSQYKFALTLDILDGNEGVLETWVCEGCWIKSVDYGTLDYDQYDKLKLELTIRFDHAYQTFGSYSGPGFATGGHG